MPARITMYHSATTGDNDAHLTSILRHGIVLPAGYVDVSHQRNGFFVNSNPEYQKMQAIDCTRGYGEGTVKRPGKPMLITVTCHFGTGFDLDYEEAAPLAKKILFAFQDHLKAVSPGVLRLREGYLIEKIRPVYDDHRDGLEIDLVKEDTRQPQTLFMSWDKDMQTAGIAEAGLLQVLRDYLVSTVNGYAEREAEHIEKAVSRHHGEKYSPGVSMKYHGSKPPEIVKLETFNGQAWEAVPVPDRSSRELT